MTHIDATYYDYAGTNYLKINHTSLYRRAAPGLTMRFLALAAMIR